MRRGDFSEKTTNVGCHPRIRFDPISRSPTTTSFPQNRHLGALSASRSPRCYQPVSKKPLPNQTGANNFRCRVTLAEDTQNPSSSPARRSGRSTRGRRSSGTTTSIRGRDNPTPRRSTRRSRRLASSTQEPGGAARHHLELDADERNALRLPCAAIWNRQSPRSLEGFSAAKTEYLGIHGMLVGGPNTAGRRTRQAPEIGLPTITASRASTALATAPAARASTYPAPDLSAGRQRNHVDPRRNTPSRWAATSGACVVATSTPRRAVRRARLHARRRHQRSCRGVRHARLSAHARHAGRHSDRRHPASGSTGFPVQDDRRPTTKLAIESGGCASTTNSPPKDNNGVSHARCASIFRAGPVLWPAAGRGGRSAAVLQQAEKAWAPPRRRLSVVSRRTVCDPRPATASSYMARTSTTSTHSARIRPTAERAGDEIRRSNSAGDSSPIQFQAALVPTNTIFNVTSG